MWTAVLVSTGVTAVWLSAKHWWGWALGVGNEVLWFAYGIHTHDHPIMLMSWVWGAVNARNAFVTWRTGRVLARASDL